MSGLVRGDGAAGGPSDHLLVWHALVAYLGDVDEAGPLLPEALIDHGRGAGPERWARLFDTGLRRSFAVGVDPAPAEADEAVELLALDRDRDSFGSGTAGLSRLLKSLGSLADLPKRAVISKHVCGLDTSDIAVMLAVPEDEADELVRRAESSLAATTGATTNTGAVSPSGHLTEPPARTTARRFSALENLPLPAAPNTEAAPPPAAEASAKRSAALSAAAVAAVAVIGLFLVIGNTGIAATNSESDAEDEPETSTSRDETSLTTVAPTTAPSTTGSATPDGSLSSILVSPDRSLEILVTPLGEVVRRDPETGEELWRTPPLGDVELASVDLNSVTVTRDGTDLFLSIVDGTFLPP